jgi:hypothetical protein
MYDYEIKGACLQIWRQESLNSTYKEILGLYADYLNIVCVSFTVRFMEPDIKTKYEESQIIQAIGYRPKEEICICGFIDPIFYAAEEILMKFGGYLRAGVPEDVVPITDGIAHRIWYEDEIETDYDDNSIIVKRGYHLLDGNFVRNYFNVRRDPAVLDIFSLDKYTIHGIRLIDLLSKGLNN